MFTCTGESFYPPA